MVRPFLSNSADILRTEGNADKTEIEPCKYLCQTKQVGDRNQNFLQGESKALKSFRPYTDL